MTSAAYFRQVQEALDLIESYPIHRAVEVLLQAHRDDRQLFLGGNGGSAATATHLVADFEKILFGEKHQALRATALHDNLPTLTAWSNDGTYQDALASTLAAKARDGDVLLAISGSGDSENILRAVNVARKLKLPTIGFSGYGGGRLAGEVEIPIIVPSHDMQVVEDCHLVLGHYLFKQLREKL